MPKEVLPHRVWIAQPGREVPVGSVETASGPKGGGGGIYGCEEYCPDLPDEEILPRLLAVNLDLNQGGD
jgi:hypothetical protein